jgi:pyruvate,water dikinase
MTNQYTILFSNPEVDLEVVGGKGLSLSKMVAAGLPVPDGFHISTAAYRHFVRDNQLQDRIMTAVQGADLNVPQSLETASQAIKALFENGSIPDAVVEAVEAAYREMGESEVVAVRSSATAEDLPELSFAGQQDTFLNIQGVPAVLDAVKRCWASLWTARAIGYRMRNEIDQEKVNLAVVIQKLVPAEVSGILFTINPISGEQDEAFISASWGLGEAIVGGAVNPDAIRVEKLTQTVVTYDIGDKELMTVRNQTGTHEQPVPEAQRAVAVLNDAQISELTVLGNRIESLYEMPMDIEWTLHDNHFAIVQARPITTLGTIETPKLTWKMPNPKSIYMRASIIDLLPDPLSPIFATLGIWHINTGIHRLIKYLTNSENVRYPDETMVTINHYAYLVSGYTFGEWVWLLTHLVPKFPRMLRTGRSYWEDEVRPKYVAIIEGWQTKSLPQLSNKELYRGINEILDVFVEHLGSLMAGTMGVSAGSEGLFTNFYNKQVRREGDPLAPTFLMGYNTTPIRSEKSLFDITQWVQDKEDLVQYLLETPTHRVKSDLQMNQIPENMGAEHWQDWVDRIAVHNQQFGHLIYDMDFAEPLPMDDPTPLIETCKMYLRGEGINPHERQARLAAERDAAVETMFNRLRGLRRAIFKRTLKWAQSLAEVREDGIADIGLGFPQLRRMLLELGERFSQAEVISETDDIFWLEKQEIEALIAGLESGQALPDFKAEIAERKTTRQMLRKVVPPPKLPPTEKYMGFKLDSFTAMDESVHTEKLIKGLGASPGSITAQAVVLDGPEDFGKMSPGEILVANITTPAWTPLFAMAAGVVTDVGGPLSHGSIVAREYGIPAVLGTGVATRRIRNGQTITVDGSSGTVTLHNHHE